MASIDDDAKERSENRLEALVGISVVLLATFLGLCNVKDGNIVQQMQTKQSEVNNKWAWYQARNIRTDVYHGTVQQLAAPLPGDTAETRTARKAVADDFVAKIESQKVKMAEQKAEAEVLEAEIGALGKIDDQFDLAEASLGIALAMMGVTALIKRWWMFVLALIPSAFGIFMGIAGFTKMDTSFLGLDLLIELLT